MKLACNLVKTSAILALFALAPYSVAEDVDCAMCHDTAPVSGDHMPVDEVTVESCTMCHAAESDDPFFTQLHKVHGEELGCDSCHGDDSPDRRTKLKDMLGG